jgi:hypothetical protein
MHWIPPKFLEVDRFLLWSMYQDLWSHLLERSHLLISYMRRHVCLNPKPYSHGVCILCESKHRGSTVERGISTSSQHKFLPILMVGKWREREREREALFDDHIILLISQTYYSYPCDLKNLIE